MDMGHKLVTTLNPTRKGWSFYEIGGDRKKSAFAGCSVTRPCKSLFDVNRWRWNKRDKTTVFVSDCPFRLTSVKMTLTPERQRDLVLPSQHRSCWTVNWSERLVPEIRTAFWHPWHNCTFWKPNKRIIYIIRRLNYLAFDILCEEVY